MKRRIIIRAHAKRDLEHYATFISTESPDAAISFLKAAEETFKGLANMRYKGIQYQEALDPDLTAMRRFAINGFEKYLIFYLPMKDGIDVIRVIHGSRDIETIFDL